ncbi:predicted protein, partial [Scheffersomyces stipitis CBS 6054]
SPSLSSVSSANSDNSTNELIKSLSSNKLSDGKEEEVPEDKTLPLPKPNAQAKKPIRFTVRKVSHEPPSIKLQSRRQRRQQEQKQSKTRVVDPTGEEATREREKLNRAQHKYDSYENRIRKIDKEIEFLTKLLPPYNVEIDYATRTKITKAVEKLRMKQDEIEKKKYSLGITISRLWRGHEGTDIWVRSFSQ